MTIPAKSITLNKQYEPLQKEVAQVPTKTAKTLKGPGPRGKTHASSLRNNNHSCHPMTQDWMHWIRTGVQGKNLSASEIIAGLRTKVVPYSSYPRAAEFLYVLTKAILAGPIGSHYSIPGKTDRRITAYFFQDPDPRHPRHQEVAPKAKNLTAQGLYQDPESKAVPLMLVIESPGEIRKALLLVRRGEIELRSLEGYIGLHRLMEKDIQVNI